MIDDKHREYANWLFEAMMEVDAITPSLPKITPTVEMEHMEYLRRVVLFEKAVKEHA